MKHLNFLSKSGSRSCGHSSVTLASTVGSPSAHRRGIMLKLISVLVLILTFGVGNVWGAEDDTHDFSQSISQGLNNCQTFTNIVISEQTYTIKSVKITYAYNKSNSPSATVKIGETTIGTETFAGTGNLSTYKTLTFSPASPIKGAVTIIHNSGNSCSGSSKGTLKITNVQLVEGASAAPAYTITATRNNDSYGTVSVSGTTITATPADCYQVASGASGYTVTSGTATVSHTSNSNTLTVTPSSDCTVQVNFEKKTVNTYIDEIQGNDDIEACGTHDAPSLDDKTPASSGTCAQQHWHFMGWVTEANKATPTDLNIIAPGTEMTASGATYYAVWAKGTEGANFNNTAGGTFKIYANVNSTKYYATGTGGKITASTDVSDAAEYVFEKQSAGVYYIKTGDEYIKYNSSTNLGTQNTGYRWTVTTGIKGSWRLTSETSDRGFIYRSGTGFGGYSTGNVSTGGSEYYDVEIGGGYEYSDYKTVCCTELGQINGSFFWTTHFCPAWPAKHRS